MASEHPPGPHPDDTNSTVLYTERLEMSFGNDSDAEILFPHVHGDPGKTVTDWLLWDGPNEVEDMAEFFRKHTTGQFVPDGFNWLIRDRVGDITGATGTPMGALGLRQRGPIGRCTVGYWLAAPYWGRGVMSEAVDTVVRHGFEVLGVVKFEAEVFVENERSIALLEKLGFDREGTIRRAQFKRGRWVDEHIYGLTRETFGPPPQVI